MARTYEFDDYSDMDINLIRDAIKNGLRRCGEMGVASAKSVVPVLTGLLQSKIDFSVGDDEVTVYADTPYATYVEVGAQGRAPKQYMTPAMNNNMAAFGDAIRDEISKVM